MRQSRLFLGLCLICTLALTWSLAASTAGSAPAESPETSSETSPLPEELFLPDPELLAPCSATLDCEDGNVISCTGNSSCTANQWSGYVECDGQRTTCPNFCELTLWCTCECRTTFTKCTSLSGNCQQTGSSITCDGNTITCTQICSKPCPPTSP